MTNQSIRQAARVSICGRSRRPGLTVSPFRASCGAALWTRSASCSIGRFSAYTLSTVSTPRRERLHRRPPPSSSRWVAVAIRNTRTRPAARACTAYARALCPRWRARASVAALWRSTARNATSRSRGGPTAVRRGGHRAHLGQDGGQKDPRAKSRRPGLRRLRPGRWRATEPHVLGHQERGRNQSAV